MFTEGLQTSPVTFSLLLAPPPRKYVHRVFEYCSLVNEMKLWDMLPPQDGIYPNVRELLSQQLPLAIGTCPGISMEPQETLEHIP